MATFGTTQQPERQTMGIDDLMQQQDKIIDRFGWVVIGVFPTEQDPVDATSFAYTVGLTEHDHPELTIAGLPMQAAHVLLNDLAARVYYKSQQFSHGQHVDDLLASGYVAVIVEGPATSTLWPGVAIERYGAERVRLQQVVWPSKDGQYPWDFGYDIDPSTQPVIANASADSADGTSTPNE